jgi:hypothetical protein
MESPSRFYNPPVCVAGGDNLSDVATGDLVFYICSCRPMVSTEEDWEADIKIPTPLLDFWRFE